MTTPELIDSDSHPAIRRVLDVMKPGRGIPRTALIEDAEPIAASVAAGVHFHEVFSLAGQPVPGPVLEACLRHDVPMRLVSPTVVNAVFKGDRRPKTFGLARVPRPHRLDDLLATGRDLVLLDGVRIVGNIGAIVRTSYALGAGGIVLVDSELASVADRRLVRASRAYVFSLPVVLTGHDEAATFLADHGIEQVSFEADGDLALSGLSQLPGRLALVFGSEKRGPSEGFSGSRRVSIPMHPGAESLNVSVSVGIGLAQRVGRNLT